MQNCFKTKTVFHLFYHSVFHLLSCTCYLFTVCRRKTCKTVLKQKLFFICFIIVFFICFIILFYHLFNYSFFIILKILAYFRSYANLTAHHLNKRNTPMKILLSWLNKGDFVWWENTSVGIRF